MEVKIKVDVTRTQQQLKELQKVYEKVAVKTMQETTEFLAKRSALNAPILTGALRQSIKAEKPEVKKDVVTGGVVAGGSKINYALKLHEEPFKLGPRSVKQQPQPEGGVGNKYIERVVKFYKGWLTYTWSKAISNLPPLKK